MIADARSREWKKELHYHCSEGEDSEERTDEGNENIPEDAYVH